MIKTTLLCLLLAVSASAAPKVTFLIGPKAPPLDKAAAEQLAGDFKALFDAVTTVTTTSPAPGCPRADTTALESGGA